jgi:hypothetical protein
MGRTACTEPQCLYKGALYFNYMWRTVLHKVNMILPYILESNPHTFYSFRGLKNQMQITIACGLDSRLRAGFWKNWAAVRAVRTIQYNNLLFYLLLIIIYYSSDSPSSLITELLSMLRRDCAHLLRKTHFTVPVWIIGPRHSVGF